MLVHLIFKLPEEAYEHSRALNASKFYKALEEIDRQISNWRKLEQRESIPLKELEEKFIEIIKSHGFDL